MLQRAASNAYSWWWASHIRTKQSKWLEQNLQDMEEKVQTTLKLIEEDGDSFAKRAEMYYKKRPELIHFVEESYRAYRALAERYDHISTELQNANNTIASVFPEQVQFMEEDDDETPRFPRKFQDNAKGNIPKVPKAPKDLKGMFASATKKIQSKKPTKTTNAAVAKSGMSKSKGLKEIDRLQKEILALQTEKEFVKSSYESGLAKYWEIEQTITDIQEKICSLQDEFGAGTVIEDDEARALMASVALKSCQDTLAQLQEKQEKSAEEAIVEGKRIDDAREKLKSLKDEFLHDEINEEKVEAKNKSKKAVKEQKSLDKESSSSTQQKNDLEMLRVKIREHFDVGSNASLSVTELAEKIDELVNKVIGLEAAVSSQTALIQRLRTETDELQTQIGILEDDKATLISGKNDLTDKLRKMEEKLLGLQELNQSVEDQNNNLQTHFTEPHYNIYHTSEKVHNVKPDEELEGTLQTEWGSVVDSESQQVTQKQGGASSTNHGVNKLQKLNSKDKHRDLGKAHEQHGGQEGALKPDGRPYEPQKVKQHEALKVSGSVQIEEEFSAEVNSRAEWKQCEEKLDPEELKASDSSQKEKEIYAEVLMVSESPRKEKEVSAEVNSQAELKQQEEKLNSEALMVSNSSQKEKEFSAKVNSQGESKQQEEKLNSEALMVSNSSQKEKEFSAEVNSNVEFKQQEEKLNIEELMVSDSSQIKVSNSSHAEKEFSYEVTLQADLEKQEEKCNTEEPEVSDSSQMKEFSAEVNLQAELKIQDEKLNKVPSRSHEESVEQESTQDPDGNLDKKQNAKPQGEKEISDSSQKEKAINQKNDEEEMKENDPSTSNRNQGENVSVLQASNDTDSPLEKSHDIEMEEKVDRQASPKAVDDVLPVKTQAQDAEPDWKQLFTNGMENREKTLLTEYTTILRNYKEVKKKLNEVENKNKNGDGLFDTMVQLRELKNANAKKDEQIKLLRQKLNLLQIGLGEDDESEKSNLTESPSVEREVIYDVRVMMMDEPEISPIEKKFRMSIDELLEENLDFWLRFSSTFSQIQKFETEIKDLQSELLKLEEKQKKLDGSTTAKYSLKSDAKPLYKHLREIHTELSVWLEKSALLKDELKSRFSSLCEIQEEITVALKESAEDEDFKFTSYQAAKFQGEILNMKQENNKVADELQAGLDHITTLQLELERTLAKLNDDFKLGASKNAQTTIQLQRSDSRSRVPLRSFIFGVKPKKQKHSIFSCVHPVLQRKYNGLKSGINV